MAFNFEFFILWFNFFVFLYGIQDDIQDDIQGDTQDEIQDYIQDNI